MLRFPDLRIVEGNAIAWRAILIIATSGLLVGAVARLTVPQADVRLSFRSETDPGDTIRLISDRGRWLSLLTTIDATDRNVAITSTGTGHVSLRPAVTSEGVMLADLSQYAVVSGDWRVEGDWEVGRRWNGGVWTVSGSGATLSWSGYAPTLQLEFVTSPLAGSVEVVADGITLPPVLLAGPEGTKRVDVSTDHRRATGMINVADLPATIDLPADATALSVTIICDGRTVYSAELPEDTRRVSLPHVGHPSGFTYARRAGILVIRGFCVNAFFVFLGAPYCLALFAHRSAVVSVAAAWAAGMSFVVLITTSLTYVLPGTQAVILASGGVAVIGIAICVGYRSSLQGVLSATKPDSGLPIVFVTGFAGALFAFAPAITEDGWFLGHSLTDSFEYIGLSELLIGTSLHDAGVVPLRVADLATLVTISAINGIDAREGFAVVGFTLLMMLPLLTHAILDVATGSASTAACGAVLSASMSIFPQLFGWCYFAQYINAFVLYAGLLSGCMLLDAIRPAPRLQWWASQCALAGPLALGVALYPYHAFPAFMLLAGLFVQWLRRPAWPAATLLAAQVALVALLNNRSLAIVNDFVRTLVFNAGTYKSDNLDYLDALARNIVFPFHSSFRFVSIVTGCRDITLNHTYWPQLFALAGGVPWWMPTYANSLMMAAVVAGLMVAVVVGLAVLAAQRRKPAAYLALVYSVFLLATLGLFMTNRTYPYAKLLLTCGTLGAVPAAVGVSWIAQRGAVGSGVAVCFMAGFMFFNMSTTLIDQSLLRISRVSPFISGKRTLLPAVDVGVRDLDRWSRTLPPRSRVAIVGNFARVSYTDCDRVTYNRMLHALRGADVSFHESRCPLYTVAYQFGITERPIDECQYDYVIIFRGYELRGGGLREAGVSPPPILENDVFRVYRGGRGTRRCAECTRMVP